ncbi:MAG: TetR family transcriptional regulator [Alphaproteobacteria bacterium]|nr:TetR family transcriptional regulator [Alphaproteobacteria bacterium]
MPKPLSKRDVESFRDRLCDAAEALFVAKGVESATMRELAQAIGVSQMTPYRYFTDKDEILAAVRTRAFNRFADAIESFDRKARGSADAPADGKFSRAFLRGRMEAYLAFAFGNRHAYRLMFDVFQPTADRYPDLVAARDRARATLSPRIPGRPARASAIGAHMLWSQCHGAIMLELAGMLPPPLTARAILRPALETIADGLGLLSDR